MSCISDLEYRVQPEEMHWTACYEGQHCGRFATRAAALRSALADARRVRRLGHRVRVLVGDRKGHLRPASEPLEARVAAVPARQPGVTDRDSTGSPGGH